VKDVTAYAPSTVKAALAAVEGTALNGNLSVTNALCPDARLDIAAGMGGPPSGLGSTALTQLYQIAPRLPSFGENGSGSRGGEAMGLAVAAYAEKHAPAVRDFNRGLCAERFPPQVG